MRTALRRFVMSVMWAAVARRFRAEQPFVIAVTGSVGKTSTKEAIATLLSVGDRPVVKTIGNLATDSGIPLSLLGFTEQVKGTAARIKVIARSLTITFAKPASRPYWVLEYSSDKPGDLAFLGKRIPFDVAVYTSGGPVHLEYYKTQEGVAAELTDFLQFANPNARVVVNGDDQFLRAMQWPDGTKTYGVAGISKTAPIVDVRAKVLKLEDRGMNCEFLAERANGKSLFTADVAVVGKQQLAPVVAATLVALDEGFSLSAVKKGVERYEVPAGRGRLIPGKKHITIVDDSANSSPEAAVAGLAMLKGWARGRRTVAVIGNMNELGEHALEAHEEVAAAAAKTVTCLVGVGPFANAMREAAVKAGMLSHHVLAFATPEQLFSQVGQIVERNDIIYIKASQNGMRLERLVKLLMANPQDAPRLLVRQSNAWKE